jgi:outer membrane protein assembly factor BamB
VSEGRRLALLVATYEHEDGGLRQLTAPGHDAEALGETLRDPDIAGFEVTTLVNRPHHEVGRAIGELCRDRRRDDLVLLYFTGHGLKDDAGRLHLAMTDTRRDNLAFTSLPAELVDRALAGCVSRQQVLILDCCYGGAFPASGLTKSDGETHALARFAGRGRTVLTAADASQFSFEDDGALHGGTARSVFTRHLVTGLREGTADRDGDGDITLDELYTYVHDKVVDEMPQQRPKKQDDVEGRIVIARNIHWTLPGYLVNALASPLATDRLGAVDGLAHLLRIGNPLVRERATEELERLADDDSRMVSRAAAERLRSLVRGPEEGESAPPEIPQAVALPQVVAVPEPAGPVRPVTALPATAVPAPEVEATPVAPKSVEASPAPATPLPTAAPVPVPASLSVPASVPASASGPAPTGWRAQLGAAVCAPLVVADGVLYVGTDDASLHALDAATGERRWRIDTGKPVQSAPVVLGGRVHAPVRDGGLLAVDTATAEVVWRFDSGRKGPSAVAGLGSSLLFANWTYVRRLHTEDGIELWRRAVGFTDLRWVAVSDEVWTGGEGRGVFALHAGTGKRSARLSLRDSWSSARAVDSTGALYVAGGGDRDLYRVDPDGQQRWHFPTLSPVRSSPVVDHARVYAGDTAGNVYGVERDTGVVRWRISVDTALNASPAVADGVVYVGGMDGVLYAFDADTGAALDRLTTDGPVRTVPAVADGLVHVGNDAGEVQAVPVLTAARRTAT